MRADRLLSLLMLLQARGKMTARALADELEVSERTIYRDIDALSMSGVPVYGESGPDGGYALLDSYRTNLTGLTDGEVQALSMLTTPAPLAELGVGQDLRAALRKLSAALPDARRSDEDRVRQRFYLDATWWQQRAQQAPHLQTIHAAVWQDRKLRITYRPIAMIKMERVVAPYGLVAKAGVWYLVFAGKEAMHVQRVSELLEVQMLDESFERWAEFDLATFWQAWCAERELVFASFTATVRVAPAIVPELPKHFGNSIREQIAQAEMTDGRIELALSFASFEDAREQLLGFGRSVEVLEPIALRQSVRDYAEQIVKLYHD